MKLKWYGHSCFGMTLSDGRTVVTDPFDETVGYPLCTAKADYALLSHDHFDHNHVQSLTGSPKTLRSPGVYEADGLRITGVHSWHDPEQGALRGENVIHIVEAEGLRIVHLGDLGHMPDEAQRAAIGRPDVLLIPIGGTYTLTTEQAVALIGALQPRVAVAMHFSNRLCRFNITDESAFAALTSAVRLGNELEITPRTLEDLPSSVVMAFE